MAETETEVELGEEADVETVEETNVGPENEGVQEVTLTLTGEEYYLIMWALVFRYNKLRHYGVDEVGISSDIEDLHRKLMEAV